MRAVSVALRFGGWALWIFLQGACGSVSEPITTPEDVLFIGNSYTITHSMPWTIAKLIQASGEGPGFNIEVVAPGGKRLEQHWYETGALERLRARPWDYVVIQEHSTTPLYNREEFMEYGAKFAEEAK